MFLIIYNKKIKAPLEEYLYLFMKRYKPRYAVFIFCGTSVPVLRG